jgi:hypothetical protein
MEDIILEETVQETESAVEKPAKKTPARKPRATKKAAEENPAVENVVVEEVAEVKNDDGQKVIAGPKKAKTARKSNMQSKEDNVLSSRAADAALQNKKDEEIREDDSEKVALWSEKNIRWSSVGTLTKGYNIVTKEAAEQWLTKTGIREATPQEVALHYGK